MMRYILRFGIGIGCLWLLSRSTHGFNQILETSCMLATLIIVVTTSLVGFYVVMELRVILYHLFRKETRAIKTQLVTEWGEAKNGLRNKEIKVSVEREEQDRLKDVLLKQVRSIQFRRLFWWLILRAYIVAGCIFIFGMTAIFWILALLLSMIGGKLFSFMKSFVKSMKEFVVWLLTIRLEKYMTCGKNLIMKF